MVKISQIGVGQKSSGTIDGITYVTSKGVTYARAAGKMPASAYKTPAARKRQAVFMMIQMHLKYHLHTINKTFAPDGLVSAKNRYFSMNNKYLRAALDSLADKYVSGEIVTRNDVEKAICDFASAHPDAITIASMPGYQEVNLTGAWPDVITLSASKGDNTMIIFIGENGEKTVINPKEAHQEASPQPSQGEASPQPSPKGEGEQTGGNGGGVTPSPEPGTGGGEDNGDKPNL